jgi:hypothetical protein
MSINEGDIKKSFPVRELYKQYAGALAYIGTRDAKGDDHIGSAFHVGEGVFVTARHVMQNQDVVEIATTSRAEIVIGPTQTENSESSTSVHFVAPRVMRLIDGPYYHDNQTVDVAVFRVEGIDPRTPRVPLGFHLDADIEDHSFVLTEAVVLGYPPVPHTNVPRLIAARAEVNAVIDTRHTPYACFIISALARGGFSGGLVLSEFGHALGVVTESLVNNHAPSELGFMTVLSVEPIFECLARHFQLDEEVGGWTYVKNSIQQYRLTLVETAKLNPRLANAMVSVYDDDRDVFVELLCPESESLALAYSALNRITPFIIIESQSRPGYLFIQPTENPNPELLKAAALAAVNVLMKKGYVMTAGSMPDMQING